MKRELTSISIDLQSAGRVSARGEERKASVLDMISGRHDYGGSRASEVCERESWQVSLLSLRNSHRVSVRGEERWYLLLDISLTGTSTAAVGPQRYVKRELRGVSIDFVK